MVHDDEPYGLSEEELDQMNEEMKQDQDYQAHVGQMLQEYSEKFDKLCQERHEAGAAEYGQFTFLGNDVVRMMAEELADTANYCRMQFIKLMFLQDALEEKLAETGMPGEINMGGDFKGVGEVGWNSL